MFNDENYVFNKQVYDLHLMRYAPEKRVHKCALKITYPSPTIINETILGKHPHS